MDVYWGFYDGSRKIDKDRTDLKGPFSALPTKPAQHHCPQLPKAGGGSRLVFSELPLISPVDCAPVNSSSGVKLKSNGFEKPVTQRS